MSTSVELDYLSIAHAKDLANKRDRLIYRALEILPGFLAWATLILGIVLAFFIPKYLAIFIIIFDIYWLIRIAYLHFHLTSAFRMMRKHTKINWLEKLEALPTEYGDWQKIYHLVVLPFYKEDGSIVQTAINAVVNSGYPLDKFIIVVSGEEGVKTHAQEILSEIEEVYGGSAFKLITTIHPQNIVGELAGKGANTAWAGRKAKEYIDEQNLAYEDIVVSSFDIDTIAPHGYFSRLTYVYTTTEDRLRASYQPIPIYINNIWDAPSFSVITAFSTTFWAMLNQERSNRLKTFSSHSMSFKALLDVGFWKTNSVTEDNIIFFQCFLRYDGNYRVVPLYFPVYMDANLAPTFLQTAANVYRQHRRWGWGVETLPYMVFGFIKNKKISLAKKLDYGFEYIEGFWSWATGSIVIATFGWLPRLVGGKEFRQSILSVNVSSITGTILNFFLIFLVFSAFFTIILLPPRPIKKRRGIGNLWMVLQWLLTPIIMIFLVCIPALDAQTRLMFGKYMGFWATPKTRKNEVN